MADYLIDLEDDETIVLEVRKHIFVFALEVFVLVVLVLIPALAASPIVKLLSSALTRPTTVFIIFYLLWLLVLWVAFFFRWTDYYLDVWIITNKRVFDIEQRGMFNRTTSVFRLERIEDITVKISGVLATLLKYGDVHIHTAGSHDIGPENNSDITIQGARHPLEVKRVIMQAYGKTIDGLRSARQRIP